MVAEDENREANSKKKTMGKHVERCEGTERIVGMGYQPVD